MSRTVLAELETAMGSIDLGACSADELAGLTGRALAAQRVVAGYVNRLAVEARRREATGSAAPASEVLRGVGVVSKEKAERLDRRAGVGETLPEVGAGVDRGDTRPENADILAAHLERLSAPQRATLARFEAEIARRAAHSIPEAFATWLGRLVRKVTEPDPDLVGQPSTSEAERQRAASALWMKRQSDGMWRLSGQLDDERGAVLNDVLTRAARRLDPASEATANARVDALYRLATGRTRASRGGRPSRKTTGETAPADGDPTRSTAGRPGRYADDRLCPPRDDDRACRTPDDQCDPLGTFDPAATMGVGYIVDAATLAGGPHDRSVAQTWGGRDLDPTEVGRLACDTDCYAILYDRLGRPTRVGRTRRAATREQRLLLRGLYDRCPIDGTPFGECEIHHVNLPWEDGGETELDNLLPISRAWHHRVHDQGWQLKMSPDRSLEIWRPDGQLHRAIPPPQPISRE